jgi:hypothetical protein
VEVEEALREKLLADATVSSLLGSRLYPLQAPQNEPYPFALYARASWRQEMALAGPVNLKHASIRLSVYAASYASLKACVRAVEDDLQGYRGTLDGSVFAHYVGVSGGGDAVLPPQKAEEIGPCEHGLDIDVHYSD